MTEHGCCKGGQAKSPVPASQIRAVLSKAPAPVMTRRPSGLKAADRTVLLCSIERPSVFPVFASHNRAVKSQLAVKTVRPFGEKPTAEIRARCSKRTGVNWDCQLAKLARMRC